MGYQITARAQIAKNKSVAPGMVSDGRSSAKTVVRMCERIKRLSEQPGRRFGLTDLLEFRAGG